VRAVGAALPVAVLWGAFNMRIPMWV
jgi:hypothetical protein